MIFLQKLSAGLVLGLIGLAAGVPVADPMLAQRSNLTVEENASLRTRLVQCLEKTVSDGPRHSLEAIDQANDPNDTAEDLQRKLDQCEGSSSEDPSSQDN
ncbi:hypothetical protein CDD82_7415 [Ophiocordyceps australis]|uniref:Secreted protein n=1 Tax=Ophiocordyceps australis TaxID=1399860 RepID=A0A2C5XEY8_9HYPO|nr:hypothetical protein CDD82_7415 [Ophiocordyceps australis]